MSYRVLVAFTDKETKQIYHEGDEFVRNGKGQKARLEELLGTENSFGKPLIEKVEEK